jgi:hypothetical protein
MQCVAAAARQSFKEHEALVYQQLAQLIRDGVWLKSYIAAVMRVEQASTFATPLPALAQSSALTVRSCSTMPQQAFGTRKWLG